MADALSDFRGAWMRKDWVRVKNGSGAVIPPYSVVLISSAAKVNDEIVFTVVQPNAASTDFNWNGYLVTGPSKIGAASTAEGIATTLVEPGYVRYNSSGWTPAIKDVGGPKHGQLTLEKSFYGFEILGGNTTAAGNSVTIARWVGVGEVLVKNESGSPITTTGTVNVYSGAAGSEADTGMDLAIYNRSSTSWATAKFGMAAHVNNAVYGVPYQT